MNIYHKIKHVPYNVIVMVQSRTNTRVVTRGVIKALGFAGAVSTALVAPNTTILIDQYMKKIDRRSAQKTLAYLKYRKLIEVKEKNGYQYYKLTERGRDKFEKIILEELSIPTPKSWDNKWRLVMFDIPASHKHSRQRLLQALSRMNFYMLQHSAWIHPFDCEKQIGVLLRQTNLERHVSYLVIEKGNFTNHAIAHFKKATLLM